MIEVTNSLGHILAFDGRVFELFNGGSGITRVHINQMESIEVKENNKGVLQILGQTKVGIFVFVNIEPSQRGAVDDLVAQFNAARSKG